MEKEKYISFHPLAGSALLTGELLRRWEEFGEGGSPIGHPLSNEVTLRDGKQYALFQKGMLVCETNETSRSAFYVKGKIYLHWADNMHVYGHYGLPLSDPVETDDGLVQEFQGGKITEAELKDGIDLRGEIQRRGIAVREQGKRGTCSVQVMAFLLEYIYSGMLGKPYSHLSVEYLNHFGNIAEGSEDDGHCFHSMEAAYNQFGVVKEQLWPYNKEWVYSLAGGEAFTTESMKNEGKLLISDGLKLNGGYIKPLDGKPGLSDTQFAELLKTLDSGIPAGVGRDHSLSAVGYKLDKNQPGGGYIIFRNSYGVSPHFTGYQCENFEHIQATVNDIFVYEPLISFI